MFLHHDNVVHQPPGSQMPKSMPDPTMINSMAAKEMNEMSVMERETVYEDIHGVSQYTIEEPEMVDKAFYELQLEIDKIRSKPAYEIAFMQSPDYVAGRDFRLMFLRSTMFDSKQAASKMIKYFEYKRLYFGDSLLGQPIKYCNLFVDDIDWLKLGLLQVLPFRDKTGRAVIWFLMESLPNGSAFCAIRAMWYFYSLILQDEDTQKSGIVFFSCGDGLDLSQKSREFAWHASILGSYFPFRLMCAHLSVNSPAAAPLNALAHLGWNKQIRARIRFHGGAHTELMYSLMTFGIPIDYAPMTSGGNVKLKYFRQWLSQKHAMETNGMSHQEKQKLINLPRRHDILLGKGKLQQQYSGNHLFQQVIQEHLEIYSEASSRQDKLDVSKQVWKQLQNEKARFLERHDDGCNWTELLDEGIILSKITYQLRTKKPIPPPLKLVRPVTPDYKNKSNTGYVSNSSSSDEDDGDNSPSTFLTQTEGGGCIDQCFGPKVKRSRV